LTQILAVPKVLASIEERTAVSSIVVVVVGSWRMDR
jgi:hypothetical protein